MSKRFNLLHLSCLLAVVFAVSATANPTERTSFKLPNLFDFINFMNIFDKHYDSQLEQLVRQKIYLGRAFRAFISMVQYRYFKQDTYLSINVRSDETLGERQRRRMLQSVDLKQQPLVDLETIKNEFDEMSGKSNLSGYHEILLELERSENDTKRTKREQPGKRLREISPNQLIGPRFLPEKSEKISARVPSNNPDYEPLELSSSAANGSVHRQVAPPLQGDGRPPHSPWDEIMARVDNWAPVKYIKDVLALAVEGFRDPPTAKTVEADKVYADLRTTGCLFGARDQGACASCYAFMTVALYEYLYCRATGKLVPFSEQYMVDCGDRTGLGGCAGGDMTKSAMYVHLFGLELRNNYPYVARQDACAYSNDTPAARMGYIRTDESAAVDKIQPKYFDQYLEEGRPIAFGLKVNDEFDDYGGGVDQLRDCRQELAHGMLIVGHGRQDGQEYYLMRNSYSVSWGEQGYHKLSKRAAWRCSLYMDGMVTVGGFGDSGRGERINERRSSEQMEQRYGERLVKFKEEEQLSDLLAKLLKDNSSESQTTLPVAPSNSQVTVVDLKSV